MSEHMKQQAKGSERLEGKDEIIQRLRALADLIEKGHIPDNQLVLEFDGEATEYREERDGWVIVASGERVMNFTLSWVGTFGPTAYQTDHWE